MRATLVAALLSLLTVPFTYIASADSVSGTRYYVTEQSHRVAMVVDRGAATLVVRRMVANSGPRGDQAVFWIDVPRTAVATGMRSQGTDWGCRPIWSMRN